MRVPSLLALATIIRRSAESCNIWGLIVVGLLAPLAPSEPTKVAVTLAGGLVLCLGHWPGRTPLDWPILAFLASAAISTALSPGRIGFFPSFGRGDGYLVWIVYGMAALAAARLSQRQAEVFWRAILLLSVIETGIVICQVLGVNLSRISMLPPESRPYGTLSNPIFAGAFLASTIPGLVNQAHWTVLAPVLLGVFLTASRVAIAAAVAGYGLAVWKRWPIRRILGVVMAVAGVAVLFLWMSPHVAAGHYVDSSSGSGRWAIWRFVAPLVLERPLFGHGLSTLLIRGLPGFGAVAVDEPHNELLYVAYAFGLLGLGLYLWVWYTALASGARRATEGLLTAPFWKGGPQVRFGLVLLAACLLTSWSHIGLANILWLMFGLSYALTQTSRRQPPPDVLQE